jgi:hypothetical protein
MTYKVGDLVVMVAHKKGYEPANIDSGLHVGQSYKVVEPLTHIGVYVLADGFNAYLSETEFELASVQKEWVDML